MCDGKYCSHETNGSDYTGASHTRMIFATNRQQTVFLSSVINQKCTLLNIYQLKQIFFASKQRQTSDQNCFTDTKLQCVITVDYTYS